jgi:type IV secretion system T-DNA border endonuclease VirD1
MTVGGETAFRDPLQTPLPQSRKQRIDPNGYKVVSVRLREAEFAVLSEQTRSRGMSNNQALRIAARRIGGFLEIDGRTRQRLEEITRALGEISRQTARLNAAYAQSGKADLQEFAALRAGFGREVAMLDNLLRTILNVSHSRVDGRRLLEGQGEGGAGNNVSMQETV